MRLLVDTHILLWAFIEPTRLSPAARARLLAPDTEVLFSAVSIWEIAIKAALRRPNFPTPQRVLAAAQAARFAELPVRSAAAMRVADLPLHHRDPFDRLLVAQAMTEPAILITADKRLQVYSELVTLV